MFCKPEYDEHTEECVKGTKPCYGPECSVCGAHLSTELQSNSNPTMCHDCADAYVGRVYREIE